MKTQEIAVCPRCGAALAPGLLSGHCPQCLITTALDGSLSPFGDTPDSATLFGSFGDYELLAEVARGGMGVVYRARQISLNRVVAVKMLLAGEFASPDFVRRFQKEAEAAAQLQHPNIVRIHEVGQEKGQHFFSMELVEGSDLAQLVRHRPLPPNRAAKYLKSIAEAIAFAHERGTLHRDLKPSNILIDPFDQPRITDFGLARQFQEGADLTLTTQAFGSPAYMSPEQARGGEIGPAADIYSLGALLYHLLTGRPPFQSETIHEILRQAQEREPLPPRSLNPSVPQDLQTICLKCLEKDPGRRYASGRELADELGSFLDGEPIRARPIGPLERAWRWSQRRPVVAGLSTALAVAVIAGIAGILWQWRHAARSERTMALNLYAADMRAAGNALGEGDLGQARRLLALHEPRDGAPDLRGFEWRYLWNRCRGEQSAILLGHEGIVVSTAFSPNGRWAASGGMDGRLCVWDVALKRELTNFVAAGHAVWDVQFNSDGARLAAGGFNGRVEIFDTRNWSAVTNFPGNLACLGGEFIATAESSPFPWNQEPAGFARVWNLRTHALIWQSSALVRRLALSADGKTLALVSRDENPGVQVWDIQSNRLLQTLSPQKPPWALAFSSEAKRLVVSGWNRDFTVFDLANGSDRTVTNAHPLTVWSARFSPDDRMIVTASSDRTIALWDASSLKALRRLRGHENEVWSATFNPKGSSIISGGKDSRVLLWNTAPPSETAAIVNAAYSRPAFSPDGKWLLAHKLATNEWHNLVFDARTHLLLSDQPGYALGISDDSNELISFDQTRATLIYTPLTNSIVAHELPLGFPATEFPISRLTSNGRFFYCVDPDGIARIRALDGRLTGSFPVLKPPIRAAALSGDARFLAISVERDYDVHLYDVASGTLRKLTGHRDYVTGIDFSPDAILVATGGVDADVRLFETTTGHLRAALSGHLEEATDVVFSPDGRTLASIGNQSALKLWHVATSREVASLPMPRASLFLGFSPDGRRLAISRHDDVLEVLEAP